eukprot:629288-Alexandrium_andersonii.AAC.1
MVVTGLESGVYFVFHHPVPLSPEAPRPQLLVGYGRNTMTTATRGLLRDAQIKARWTQSCGYCCRAVHSA